MLSVENLNVARAGFPVLRDVSFSVGVGAIHAILGRNGAGKTTLVDSIMGLLPISGGRISVAGRDITGMKPHRVVANGVAVAPEGRRLFPNLTVTENLSIGARQDGWFWKSASSRVLEEIWTLFPDIKRFESTLVADLSGGQRQMVALGRALISRPKVLLLDEPSFGLSPQMVEATMIQVQKLAAAGLSVVLIEQNVDLVMEVASSAALLSDGRIIARGSPAEIVASELALTALFGASDAAHAA